MVHGPGTRDPMKASTEMSPASTPASAEEPPPVSFPWTYQLGQTVIDIFGKDFWPYGIEKNRKAIEALCRYTWEQGLVPVKAEIADLFAPSVAGMTGYRL